MLNQEVLEEIKRDALLKLEYISTERDWAETKAHYLGKKGRLQDLLKLLPQVSLDERKELGSKINDLKIQLEELFENKLLRLKSEQKAKKLLEKKVDITLPGKRYFKIGRVHPLTRVTHEILNIFQGLGFEVEEGPEIELDYYNFEALNIPKEHPARDMQDTFYIDESILLRTHTSPVQIRVMEKRKPPLMVVCPGKVYRRDSDVTHSPMFHQIEGFMVDKNVNFSHLKGVLTEFLHGFFGSEKNVRFRPSYFPFTEPSAEVDIECVVCEGKGCRVCKQTGWLEVLGCGMIHPYLFSVVGYDTSSFSGFAFGLGVERLTMLKYAIDDIRLFYEGHITFLEQL